MTDAAAKPAPRAPLSLADQVLANSIGFLAVQTIEDARTAMVIDALAEVLPQANRQIRAVDALASAALAIVALAPRRRDVAFAADWAAAMLAARAATADFLFWRGGLALDAWRQPLAKEAAA